MKQRSPFELNLIKNLLLKLGFYAESVNFVTELYIDCFLHANCAHVEGRSVKFSTCFLSGDGRAAQSTLWGPCVEAGSQTPCSHPSFYMTADKADVNFVWTAWEQIFGGFFPHFKGSSHHVSQVFSMFYLALLLAYFIHTYGSKEPFMICFTMPFLCALENKLRIQFMTRFTLTTQSQNMLSWKGPQRPLAQLWALQRMGNIWCELTYIQLQPHNLDYSKKKLISVYGSQIIKG